MIIINNKIPLNKWLNHKNIYLDINNKEILFNLYNDLIKILDQYNDICL